MSQLQSLFADMPYVEAKDYNYEAEFRNVMYLLLSVLGFYVQAEKHINRGRIDLIAKTHQYVYVIEFKYDGSLHKALAQIDEHNYSLPFLAEGRKVIEIGVNFSSKLRNIASWEVKRED